MPTCKEIQDQLEEYLTDEIGEQRKLEIKNHLKHCQDCSQVLNKSITLSELLQNWQTIEPPRGMYKKIQARIHSSESYRARIFTIRTAKKITYEVVKVAAVVALTLMINYWLQKPVPEKRDDSTTINFYLQEHQSVVPQTVSAISNQSEAAQMYVQRDDILYYEFFDHRPEFTRPGIIMRGPAPQPKITAPEVPAISNGHILTREHAREVLGTNLSAPARIHPGYILDKIRKIEDRNSIQLLYTDGINTISMFEQPLVGEERLAAQDFREYAVYQSKGQAGGTILAWSDDVLSFVLIGHIEMPQLMDMAQSISARNRKEE
jgi:hypothetical protein